MTVDETELIDLYFSRDEEALSLTQRHYGGMLRMLVFKILRSEQDCDECLSDVYFKLWNTIPPVRPDSFKAYALRIARTEALMFLRKRKAKKRGIGLELSLSELEEILPDKNVPDGSEMEIKEIINSFLGDLSDDARKIFLRKYWFFDSVAEISRRYNFSVSKVKSSLRASRERLVKRLKEEGVVL